MKLQCQIEVVNRLHISLNVHSKGKYVKSTLALGKEPKGEKEYFILHFSAVNKTGTKYNVKKIKQVFTKYLSEGKATLRFEEPPHDLCIKSEVVQLKYFMKLLKSCITGETKDVQLPNLSSISVIAKDNAPTKLVVNNRSELPAQGFPRTLQSLTINGLRLCNFRRDILLLRHLSILDLRNNEIEKIPPEFGRMPNLSELYLGDNNLGLIPEVDWRWLLGPQIIKTLKLLDLSGNTIKCLPKAIWKLQNLVTLNLNKNMLKKLPSTLGRISSLRYLTISYNDLTSLPCSLMQCRLESLDISSNKFNKALENPDQKRHTPWEFYIGSLVHMTSKVVLKSKQFYAANIIPWTLVEFLDNANMCICGSPVVNDGFYVNKELDLKDYFREIRFDNSRSWVNFECYFCSPRCYSKYK